jgi:hypothetical protein
MQPKAIEIGAMIYPTRTTTLLWCHVGRRTQDLACPGLEAMLNVSGEFGYAEVENLGSLPEGKAEIRHDHDVGGLEISMHNASGECRSQGADHVPHESKRWLDIH